MNYIDIIDNIFRHYQSRKRHLYFIDIALSNFKTTQVLRESKEAYGQGIEDKRSYYIDRILARKERLERLVNMRNLLFEQLNHKEKRIMVMKYDGKMTISEILDALYISESTYYRWMDKIYKKLGDYFKIFEGLFLEDLSGN